jgi:hypothetical protein
MAGAAGSEEYNFITQSLKDVILHNTRYNIDDCYDRRVSIHELVNWGYKYTLLALLNMYYNLYPIQFNDSMFYLNLWFVDYPIIINKIIKYKND